MSCTQWNDSLTGRLYGEISAEDDAALSEHLASCATCRETLEQFQRVRTVLRENEPAVPRLPRVVVLRDRNRFRPALLAASILGAAVLAGAGAGAGFAFGRGGLPSAPAGAGSSVNVASTEELVQREVDRRLAAWQSTHPAAPVNAAGKAASEPPITESALRAELAKLERRMNGARTADVDYVLDQIAASEMRVGDRIGKTNKALRTVALASNPVVNEQ